MKLGFVGLGVMGRSMAGHLLGAGHELFVHTRSRAKAEPLLERGAVWCASPAEVSAASTRVFSIVGMPEDVRAVYLGPGGLMGAAQPGSIFVDMTTSDPELASELAAKGEPQGVHVLDAPVSGGDVGARNGTLSIMVGGKREAFESVKPLFELMGKNIVLQGEAGSGQLCKLCNQVAIGATMISVCESVALAKSAGLDPTRVLESITSGAAGSWSLQNLMPRALSGDIAPGFAIVHFVKDLGLALKTAARLKLDLPGTELANRFYQEMIDSGLGDRGTQALLRRYLPA